MTAARQNSRWISPQEYLEVEWRAEFRSEYVDGIIYAMAGSSVEHATITANAVGALHSQFRGKPCRVLSPDIRVKADAARSYYYPDVTIVCGQPELEPGNLDVISNPSVIIEILSPSTEARDRGEKLHAYRKLPSLQHYLLVSQDAPLVDHYERGGEFWRLLTYEGLDAAIELSGIGCRLMLADLYERITFAPPSAEASM